MATDNKESLVERINEKNTCVQEKKVPYPKSMLVELTNACNHSCLFCSHRKMTRMVRNMDFDFACSVIRQGYELGVRELGLFMVGEPLLYTRLEEVITYAKKLGYEYIYLTTNGALANLERMKKLIAAGLDSVKFSINATNESCYELIHGKDEYTKVLENLKALYEYKKQEQIDINIFVSSVTTKYNPSKQEIERTFGNICDSLAVYQASNADGMVPETDIYLRDTEEQYDCSGENKLPCVLLFSRFHVTAEGYLTCCCIDAQNNLAYADLREMSLEEAWNNSVIQNFRKQHIENKVENSLCYNCINYTQEKVVPLDEKLGIPITEDMLCNYDEIVNRISEFEKKNK